MGQSKMPNTKKEKKRKEKLHVPKPNQFESQWTIMVRNLDTKFFITLQLGLHVIDFSICMG